MQDFDKREGWENHRKTYDIESNWDSIHADEPVKFIDEVIKTKGKHRLLDLGCGFGRHAVRYHKKGINVIGLDYGVEGLKQLKRKYSPLPTVCADIRKIPFRDKIADLILMNGVIYEIEDIEDINDILGVIYRLSTDDGTFIFIHDFYPGFYIKIYYLLQPIVPFIRKLLGKPPRTGKKRFTIWLWNSKDIRTLMNKARFRIKKEIPCNHLFGVAHWFDYLFYKKKGEYMSRTIQMHPEENVRWLGRLIAKNSRKWFPYLCPQTVYYEIVKDNG